MAKKKPQHVNLSTEPADILSTMMAEIGAVRYHKRKAYGGTRKYEAWKEQLKERCISEQQNQLSDITEWISPVGNRWIMYSSMEYLPKVDRALPCHAAFIYYETYASCGAFIPTFPEAGQKPNGVCIFTSHFFLRLSERAGIPFRSKAMIQEFISTNFMRSITSPNKVGADAYMRFRCGYGIGVVLSVEPYVVEMRTFLTEEQLLPKQRKRMQCADIDARIIDKLGDVAGPITLGMLERMGYFFCKLAQQWEGFDPSEYTSREILPMVCDALPPTYFDFLIDGSKPNTETMERIVSDTCDVLIRMADSMGYDGWTHDRIQQGIVDIMDQ